MACKYGSRIFLRLNGPLQNSVMNDLYSIYLSSRLDRVFNLYMLCMLCVIVIVIYFVKQIDDGFLENEPNLFV